MSPWSETAAAYRDSFVELREVLPGAALPWWRARRDAALDAFVDQGLPTRRTEDWKYTSLAGVKGTLWLPATESAEPSEAAIQPHLVPEIEGPQVVLSGGRLVPALSRLEGLPTGVRLLSLRQAFEQAPELLEQHLGRYADGSGGSSFVDLNTAFVGDGLLLHLAPGAILDTPIQIIHRSGVEQAYDASYSRSLMIAEAGSRALLVETYLGGDDLAYISNGVCELVLGAGAEVDHYRLQLGGNQATHLARSAVQQAADSRYREYHLGLGGALARQETRVELAGEGAACELRSLYLSDAKRHHDLHQRIDHRYPRTRSEVHCHGLADQQGHGVFSGRAVIHPGARGSAARQSSRNLLLSPTAAIDARPQLEIHNDEVTASHGATIGQLDPEALFYLRSRGIPEPRARAMLTFAFANALIEAFPCEAVRRHAQQRLSARLGQGHNEHTGGS